MMGSFLATKQTKKKKKELKSNFCCDYAMADRGLLEFKVVVLGDKGVGKTCLVLRFIEVSFPAQRFDPVTSNCHGLIQLGALRLEKAVSWAGCEHIQCWYIGLKYGCLN